MADPWDTRNTRWETLFDQAVTLADARRLSDTLSMLKRIRSWQHRQKRYGRENHDWHDAEVLWLQGVVLERARQPSKADPVWLRLAQVYQPHRETWRIGLLAAVRSLRRTSSWVRSELVQCRYAASGFH